jgi:hypothetical protein
MMVVNEYLWMMSLSFFGLFGLHWFLGWFLLGFLFDISKNNPVVLVIIFVVAFLKKLFEHVS